MKRIIMIIGVVLLISGMAWGEGDSRQKGKNRGNNSGSGNRNNRNEEYVSEDHLADYPLEDLSAAEQDGILLMREEEKLARDVYTALYDKWGLRIFDNISQSEQNHTEAVKGLIERYSLSDPMETDRPGVFENRELQELYDQLVARGSISLVDALKVGATIEDLDIFDLENLLDKSDNQDVRIVFQNLVKGSRNHLRSFMKQLERNGGSYDAAYISHEYFTRILESGQEQGHISDPGFEF